MIIYPAVDIKDGRCVRLRRGELREVTDYGDPVDTAVRFQAEGAEFLHVVDLDGAFGSGSNSGIIARIVSETGLPVEVGGGIRTRERVRDYLDKGVTRVILGTAALEDPELTAWAAGEYPGQVAAGLDARRGRLAVRGWVDQSDMDVLEAAMRLTDSGIGTIIYTDIGRDGMMAGPDTETVRRLAAEAHADVIGSGGVSTLADVEALCRAGAAGCIIGRALLDGAFTLAEAIALGRRGC